MGENSDFALDQQIEIETLRFLFKQICEKDPFRRCRWFRNDEGFLECKRCGREADE